MIKNSQEWTTILNEKFTNNEKLKIKLTSKNVDGKQFKYYLYNNKLLLSPSKLMRFFTAYMFDTNNIPISMLEKAQERGKLFHKHIEAHNKGKSFTTVNKEVNEFLSQFDILKKEYNIEPFAQEIVLFSPTSKIVNFEDKEQFGGFMCISDAIALVNGKLAILEYKFNSILPYDKQVLSGIQTKIAQIILEEQTGEKPERYTIHWSKPKQLLKLIKFENDNKYDELITKLYDAQTIFKSIQDDAKGKK